MKNKDLNGSKPLPASAEFGDDDLAATAVLDKTAIMDRESLQDESDAFLDETVRMDRDSFLDDAEGILDSTVALGDSSSATDNVGDVSVEINVEELIADIETKGDNDAARKREIRRRLEDAVEDQAFEDTYAIDLDEQAD
jgi:hypothetical protein